MPAPPDSLVRRIEELAAANNRVVSSITEMRTVMWYQRTVRGDTIRYECRHLIDAMKLNIGMIRLAKRIEESPAAHTQEELRKLVRNFEEVSRVLRETEREVKSAFEAAL